MTSCTLGELTMSLLPFFTYPSVSLATVGDPARDRTVYATIVLLVALGFALIMLAVWLLRRTRPDPEVLAPLEQMGERKWRRADPVWQRRRLDEVRPPGADPLEPSSAPPATDAEFERGPKSVGFEDLAVQGAATAAGASGLPAPSADAVPVEGPVDGATMSGDEGTTDDDDDDASSDGAAGTADVSGTDDEINGGDKDDEVDEDDTGEQDTEDLFAMLDDGDESELESAALPEAESEVEFADAPGVEPEGEHVVDAESEDDEPH